jgi:lipid-binding SYLF domain-containing protein
VRQGRRNALVVALAAVAAPLAAFAETKEEKRDDVRRVARNTLERLYREQPGARRAIGNAAGYAVFSNFGMKILFAGGGTGAGIAVNTKTKAETFMKMVEVQAGLGLGVKKFRLIWVFETAGKLSDFVTKGWEIGGQATASAQVSGKGAEIYAGAMSIAPGVWLYQLSDDGLALELTAKGTKYYRDTELN